MPLPQGATPTPWENMGAQQPAADLRGARAARPKAVHRNQHRVRAAQRPEAVHSNQQGGTTRGLGCTFPCQLVALPLVARRQSVVWPLRQLRGFRPDQAPARTPGALLDREAFAVVDRPGRGRPQCQVALEDDRLFPGAAAPHCSAARTPTRSSPGQLHGHETRRVQGSQAPSGRPTWFGLTRLSLEECTPPEDHQTDHERAAPCQGS